MSSSIFSAPSAASNGDALDIRLFSLNCWGLWLLSKNREHRLNEIAVRIANAIPPHDIVALQEVWVRGDYDNLRQKTLSILPHAKFYRSGAIGGGLVVLSRWPIEASSMFRYPLNGRPTAVHRGDYYVGKGVACATIRHPSGNTIDIFNTHLHAPYSENDIYLAHRTAQAWEIAKLLRGSVEKGNIAIGVGDFNMIPSSLAHRIISTHGLVSDSWLSFYPNTPLNPVSNATAKYNIEVLGTTCDSVLNTWRMPGSHLPDPDTLDRHAKRLDYVFHSPATSSVKQIVVGMIEAMPMLSQKGGKGGAGRNNSLSDHFAVEVVLSLTPSVSQQAALAATYIPLVPTKKSKESMGDNGVPEDITTKPSNKNNHGPRLPHEVLNEVLVLVNLYRERQQREIFWRILHFWISIPILIVIHIGVWWNANSGVAFLCVFLSWVVAVTGGLDGLIGFCATRTELNALSEFMEEIELYRKYAMSVSPCT